MKIPNNGVLKFYANWCGPCKNLAPIMEELKKEHEDIEFLDVDVDDSEGKHLAEKYGVRSIPAVIFIREGEENSRLVGLKSKAVYEACIVGIQE